MAFDVTSINIAIFKAKCPGLLVTKHALLLLFMCTLTWEHPWQTCSQSTPTLPSYQAKKEVLSFPDFVEILTQASGRKVPLLLSIVSPLSITGLCVCTWLPRIWALPWQRLYLQTHLLSPLVLTMVKPSWWTSDLWRSPGELPESSTVQVHKRRHHVLMRKYTLTTQNH